MRNRKTERGYDCDVCDHGGFEKANKHSSRSAISGKLHLTKLQVGHIRTKKFSMQRQIDN